MPSAVAVRDGGEIPARDRSSFLALDPRHSLPFRSLSGLGRRLSAALLLLLLTCGAALAQTVESTVPAEHAGGEANLVVPALNSPNVQFLGMTGEHLLMMGLIVCVLGMVFGLMVFTQLKNAPVHQSMREISELIYETCKTYLIQQLKFVAILELFIGAIIVVYFGIFQHYFAEGKSLQ